MNEKLKTHQDFSISHNDIIIDPNQNLNFRDHLFNLDKNNMLHMLKTHDNRISIFFW
jgi:hypothetical protein